MPEDWSPEEVAATVADYLVMLDHELRREPYNKKDHNRHLQSLLHARSAGAIEFKHANISAVLIELGFPYIDGYKPRANYQQLLKDEVAAQLARDVPLTLVAETIVESPATANLQIDDLSDIIVPAPVRDRDRSRGYERRAPAFVQRAPISYLERESRNASLGAAGEALALEVEDRRLRSAGHKQLAERIEHVSRSQGDGLGYDILSFETDGRERLIEVKTTSFGAMTPFFASKREVAVSEERAQNFNLYRVFKFSEAPKIFILQGSLRDSCDLDAVQFRASLL
jgi:uncharacterized protein DUF3883